MGKTKWKREMTNSGSSGKDNRRRRWKGVSIKRATMSTRESSSSSSSGRRSSSSSSSSNAVISAIAAAAPTINVGCTGGGGSDFEAGMVVLYVLSLIHI